MTTATQTPRKSGYRPAKNPSPLTQPDRRRRTWKRQKAIERELAALITAQHRVVDIDTEMWIEQAAVAQVNLEIVKAAKSRGAVIEGRVEQDWMTKREKALKALTLRPTFFEAPLAPKPIRPLSSMLRDGAAP